MKRISEAYLDIETTGLNSGCDKITVVGTHLDDGIDTRFIQLVGQDITASNILEALQGATVIYTYNGSRFDLPFIYSLFGTNLASLFEHCDLMYDCWRNNLYGGLKAVERQLGIERRLREINGLIAIRLWWQYKNQNDENALATLLEYNKEDVLNLKILRGRLL